MKKYFIITLAIVLTMKGLSAQDVGTNYYKPIIAVKTNGLYWATATPNLSAEMGLSKKLTLDILGTNNHWKFSANKKIKHWLVQPELRYWLCERFSGHFLGVHGHYAQYNVGGFGFLGLKNKRYQGDLFGAGVSYGYQWIIGNRWNLEAMLGLGYARIRYDEYTCEACGGKVKDGYKNYWGLTRLGFSIAYFIK